MLILMVQLKQTGICFVDDDETGEDGFELTEGLAIGICCKGGRQKPGTRKAANDL